MKKSKNATTTLKFESFYIHASHKQVGDRKRDKTMTYHLILRPADVTGEPQRRFLAEFNTMTKKALFRNERGQLIEVEKMTSKNHIDWVYAMASKIFQTVQH